MRAMEEKTGASVYTDLTPAGEKAISSSQASLRFSKDKNDVHGHV